MNEVQQKLLIIASDFAKFAERFDLDYCMLGGTALGAVRHNGFIPWDDDIDFILTNESYKKLLDNKENFPEGYYFQTGLSGEWPLNFSKIRMNDTLYVEEEVQHRNMHQGLYIDIMKFTNMSNFLILRYAQYALAKVITAMSIYRRGNYKSYGLFKRGVILYFGLTSMVISPENIERVIDMMSSKDSTYVGHLFGKASFEKCIYKRSEIFPCKSLAFEGLLFPAMNNVTYYLSKRYGINFMEIPDQKTIDSYAHNITEVKL